MNDNRNLTFSLYIKCNLCLTLKNWISFKNVWQIKKTIYLYSAIIENLNYHYIPTDYYYKLSKS